MTIDSLQQKFGNTFRDNICRLEFAWNRRDHAKQTTTYYLPADLAEKSNDCRTPLQERDRTLRTLQILKIIAVASNATETSLPTMANGRLFFRFSISSTIWRKPCFGQTAMNNHSFRDAHHSQKLLYAHGNARRPPFEVWERRSIIMSMKQWQWAKLEDGESGMVVDELRRGYLWNNELTPSRAGTSDRMSNARSGSIRK